MGGDAGWDASRTAAAGTAEHTVPPQMSDRIALPGGEGGHARAAVPDSRLSHHHERCYGEVVVGHASALG